MTNPEAVLDTTMPQLRKLVSQRTGITASTFWYGAVDINPKHCAIWITVETDEEKNRVARDIDLHTEGTQLLVDNGYPPEARKFIHVGVESQETVDREWDGNWYVRFK